MKAPLSTFLPPIRTSGVTARRRAVPDCVSRRVSVRQRSRDGRVGWIPRQRRGWRRGGCAGMVLVVGLVGLGTVSGRAKVFSNASTSLLIRVFHSECASIYNKIQHTIHQGQVRLAGTRWKGRVAGNLIFYFDAAEVSFAVHKY
jgi:hypothetical protein